VTPVTAARSEPSVRCLPEVLHENRRSQHAGDTENVLFLTDFSEPSEAALPFAVAIAREYGAKVHALHVLTPTPYVYSTPDWTVATIGGQEESAQAEIARVGAQLAGLPHETMIERGFEGWPTLEQAVGRCEADIIVLGTHGRTGAQKFILGSVAEEIFRRSSVPVLTIGPGVHSGRHNGAEFHRVHFATDFTPESLIAAPYAISVAQENQARLLLLRVIRDLHHPILGESSIANVMFKLNELVPKDVELWCSPETVVACGNRPNGFWKRQGNVERT
jgi:nucleotide-binding universal stress UspA family protein